MGYQVFTEFVQTISSTKEQYDSVITLCRNPPTTLTEIRWNKIRCSTGKRYIS